MHQPIQRQNIKGKCGKNGRTGAESLMKRVSKYLRARMVQVHVQQLAALKSLCGKSGTPLAVSVSQFPKSPPPPPAQPDAQLSMFVM